LTLPELWIPYGPVETLVTIQAENLGTVVEPSIEGESSQQESHGRLIEGVNSLFVSDAAPSTLELLKELVPVIVSAPLMKVFSPAPKRLESAIPEVKGRVSTLPPPIPSEGQEVTVAHDLTEPGSKLFIATGRPDPLFGLVDAKVQACMNWVANSHGAAAQVRKEMEPSPFQKTASFSKVEEFMDGVADGHYATVVPRGGRVRSVLVDAPFDAVKSGFLSSEAQPTKGMIVGAGGAGYDETLSGALRGVWGALPGLRKSGSLLLVAECSEGLGSPALEMVATGRLPSDAERRRGKYVEGLEEISYLNRLKQDYDVLLLSALPEMYAKGKLGLSTARGSGEAVGRLLNRVGRTARVNVITRAPECRLSSG
jgi:hypothetical protein